MALNLRQARFLEAYLETGNATQAYIKAGYSPNAADKGAYKLLRKAEIAKEVARLKEAAGFTREGILEKYKHLHEYNSEVDVDNQGRERMKDASVAHKSLDSVAKILRLFNEDGTERANVTNNYVLVEAPRGRTFEGRAKQVHLESDAETVDIPSRGGT